MPVHPDFSLLSGWLRIETHVKALSGLQLRYFSLLSGWLRIETTHASDLHDRGFISAYFRVG